MNFHAYRYDDFTIPTPPRPFKRELTFRGYLSEYFRQAVYGALIGLTMGVLLWNAPAIYQEFFK